MNQSQKSPSTEFSPQNEEGANIGAMDSVGKAKSNLYQPDSIATSFAVNTLASVYSRGMGLARTMGLAYLIPIDQYGYYSVALLVANVLLPICSLGFYDGAARFAPMFEAAGRRQAFLKRLLCVLLVIVPATTIPILVFSESLGRWFFLEAGKLQGATIEVAAESASPLMRAVVFYVICLAFYHAITNTIKGLRMFRLLSWLDVVVATVFTAGAVGAAAVGFKGAGILVVLSGITCLAPALLFVPGLWKTHPDSSGISDVTSASSEASLSSMFRFSMWAAGSAIVWNLMIVFPSWYLLKALGGETAGAMGGVRNVTQVVQLGAIIVANNVSANVTGLWELRGREVATERLAILTKMALMALLAGGVVTSLLGWPIMKLFPQKFEIGLVAYDPMVLCYLLIGLVALVSIRLNLLHKPSLVMVSWIFAAIVNVGMTYWLIESARGTATFDESMALRAAAWAGVAGGVVGVALCILMSQRCGLPFDGRSIALCICLLSVGLGWWVSLPLFVLLFVISIKSRIIFSHDERGVIYNSLKTAVGR